jgi:hypothetical protein
LVPSAFSNIVRFHDGQARTGGEGDGVPIDARQDELERRRCAARLPALDERCCRSRVRVGERDLVRGLALTARVFEDRAEDRDLHDHDRGFLETRVHPGCGDPS